MRQINCLQTIKGVMAGLFYIYTYFCLWPVPLFHEKKHRKLQLTILCRGVQVSFQEPEQSELWSTEKAAAGGAEGGAGGGDQRFMGGAPLSPPPPLVMPGSMMASPPMFSQAAALSSPVAEQSQKKHSNASDDAKVWFFCYSSCLS